ncbi:hypothetical protein HYALB_00013729 [Hymenoscyphus albidus]|uniref:Secreted protein n=1 Tax=Hymenoscyphus albidus TaxID=595503 RepID=A0A9N9Q052_9HELO|nr:hypothetical protein HYALB_00013729 [Hymenoscyphus albidus]
MNATIYLLVLLHLLTTSFGTPVTYTVEIKGRNNIRLHQITPSLKKRNKNDFDLWPDAKYIASYADDILAKCATPTGLVCGQAFDDTHYNVIAKKPQKA